jgi:hypothetical protein
MRESGVRRTAAMSTVEDRMKTTGELAYLGSSPQQRSCSRAVGAEISGRYTNVVVSLDTIEVAKGHSVIFFVTRTSAASDNVAPSNALVGECGGYTVTMLGGETLSTAFAHERARTGTVNATCGLWSRVLHAIPGIS